MTLDDLIQELRKRDPTVVVRNGFSSGHSDRGDYSNVAFTPVDETTIGEMLHHAESIKGQTIGGFKGGTFLMAGYVEAHIGEWGECGDRIGRHHFLYWDTFAPNPSDNRAGEAGPGSSPC